MQKSTWPRSFSGSSLLIPQPYAINDSSADKPDNADDEEPNDKEDGKEKPDSPTNHGHRPASDYTQAKTIEIAHQTLQKGSVCPSCQKGKLFQLKPGSIIRIVGQPWLQVEICRPERLRCPVCGKVFTAALPQEMAVESRADFSAKAIVSLLKYRACIPLSQVSNMAEQWIKYIL